MNTLETFRKILLGEPIESVSNEERELLAHHGLGARAFRLLPPLEQKEFFPAHLYVVQRRSLFARELMELTAHFSQVGIQPIILKGPVLADRFYPQPADRPFSDLDFLFDPKDRERVGKVLEKDFVRMPQKRFAANEHKEDWQKKTNPDVKVEAHYGLGEKFPGGFEKVEWQGYSVLAPHDEFLFLLWHGFVQHRMQKLMWFLDLFYISRNIDYAEIRHRCEELELQPALQMFLQWLEWLQGVGNADPYLKRVILAKNENPIQAAKMRAKLNGGWWKLAQYAWQRKFSSDEF